jgi:hypothetical protein
LGLFFGYIVAHGTEEHHDDHEKKSVLKKVKAKAKKIKDTITKHGHRDDNEHGHGHDQYHNQHIPDDHDLDEEDDEDVHDPEIHGAPSKVFFLSFLLTHKKLSF